MEYKCIKCGLCCRNLDYSDLYLDLHNGNGICFYLDQKTNLCSIYYKRPILCNIDLCYKMFFLESYTLSEFYALNYEGCKNLWMKNQN